MKKTLRHLFYILKLLRPRQWMKNLALFAAITFGGLLVHLDSFVSVCAGFVAFCLLASSTYIINDLIDVNKDRLHPFKKVRPIASGEVSPHEAIVIFIVIILGALIIAQSISGAFFFYCILYLVIQFLYSFIFKSIEIFDIFFIVVIVLVHVVSNAILCSHTKMSLHTK